jgi:hypothetical protein
VDLKVNLSSRRPNALCWPMIEAVHLDHKVNPYIHDFDVEVQHGQKTSYFRVFVKRGKRILANKTAVAAGLVGEIVILRLSASDGTTLVNARSTDGAIMDFVLSRCVVLRVSGPFFLLISSLPVPETASKASKSPNATSFPLSLKSSTLWLSLARHNFHGSSSPYLFRVVSMYIFLS